MHIYDPAVLVCSEYQGGVHTRCRAAVSDAAESDRNHARRNREARNYGVDNRATVDGIAQFGADARGVAVLDPSVTDTELKELHDGDTRGIRCSLGDPATAVVTAAMIEPLARRVAVLGWHTQFNMSGEQIVELTDVLRGLPTQIVFNHLASPPLPAGITHPSDGVVRELLDQGRA